MPSVIGQGRHLCLSHTHLKGLCQTVFSHSHLYRLPGCPFLAGAIGNENWNDPDNKHPLVVSFKGTKAWVHFISHSLPTEHQRVNLYSAFSIPRLGHFPTYRTGQANKTPWTSVIGRHPSLWFSSFVGVPPQSRFIQHPDSE